MSSLDGNNGNIGILARPLSIEGVGADNTFPPEASIQGAKLLIPEWEAPSQQTGKSDLLEVWVVASGASVEELFYSNLFPVPVVFPDYVLLPANYLQQAGDVRIRYRVTQGDSENEDTSSPQVFHVIRATPVNLAEPSFPSATLWGYLNCSSQPKLWERLIVHVPAQAGRFAKDDTCALDWEGFLSLNGVGPIAGTALRVTKILTQEEASSAQGFDLVLESDKYEQYVKPMEKNASALASYTLYRNGSALGKSPPALVKIDRVIPGQTLPCGPGATGLDAIHAFSDVKDPLNEMSMEFKNMNMQVKSGGVLAEPPVIVGQLPDNRLTYQQLKVDGTIEVQLASIADQSPEGGAKVELHLFPKGEEPIEHDPTYVIATQLKADQSGGDWTFPIKFQVPTDGFKDVFSSTGEYNAYELAFIVYDDFGNADTSGPFTEALIDLTAPYQRQPGTGNGTGTRPSLLTLDAAFPAVIDDAWLADPANSAGLTLTIPNAYQKFEANNDQVKFYISTQTTFGLMQGETPAYSGPVPATGIVNIPLAFLEALNEGVHYYSYNLTDLPGNVSNNAAITLLFNRVKAPKPVLDVPRIPVTNGGAVPITFATVRPSPSLAIMEIDHPLHSIPGDRIIPYLYSSEDGPTALPEQDIPPANTPGPLRFELDYATLAPFFGNVNKDSETELEYYYELERSTISPNPVSAPQQFAVIDFSYAGPEQPNLPDPLNPNIDPVEVQGAGTPQPAPNTLGPDQAGMAAAMNWPIWGDVDRPVTGREIVRFFYQGKPVGGPVPVRAGDTEVTTSLPWATILAEGNGTVAGGDAREAYITIEYPGSENGMTQAPTTKIDVTAIVIDLPVPQIVVSAFTGATGSPVPERIATSINCPSLDHPVVANGPKPPYQPRQLRIRVRRDANIPTGTTVDLVFEGRVTNAPGGAVIPNTRIEASAQMPATGDLEFRLTDYAKIKEIQLPSTVAGQRPPTRYARIAYTANGIEAAVTVPVALLNSSLVYCEEERPEPTP
ncbi:hypothetical protein ACN079_20030 [Pseudomonas sp. ABY48]|uniref:hypothetical protein n=1 Tax=Pseudomonas sp. ABY48 TaxID=3402865 RepID=UPI003B42A073